MFVNQLPDTFQEAVRPFNAGFLPFQRHISRRSEHHEQTYGVGAVTFNHNLRVDTVIFRLGHFAHAGIHQFMAFCVLSFDDTTFLVALNDGINRRNPVTLTVCTNVIERIGQHHTLAQQLFSRFVRVDHTRIAHQLVEEAEVEQVHDGVFNTTNVDINRQPVVCSFWIQHPFVVLRAGVARVVPGGFHKSIESVGFAQCRHAVNGGFCPLRIGFDWAGNTIHNHVFRQNNRQLVFWRRQYGTVFQCHHRNRRAPVTLTGNTPVTQTVVYFTLTHAKSHQLVSNGIEGCFEAEAVKLTGVKQYPFFGQSLFGQIRLCAFSGQNYWLDGQAIFSRKLVIALIVARNGHDCARTVFHQDEVCCPNRDLFASQRVNGFKARVDAFLLHGCHFGFSNLGVAAFVNEGGQFRVICSGFLRQRVTCGNGQIGRTHKGVRTGCVNGQRVVVIVHIEGDFYAFRTANPVALHRFHGVRPVIQVIQVTQQFVSVSGDFDEPLRDLFTLDFGITTPAASVDNLFVRQYGLVIRAPVDSRRFLVHQAFFVQLGEEFLFPTVIFRGAGRQLTAPVVTETQHFELVFHVCDVVVRPRCRRGVVFNRSTFCWQTERIPANWLQYVFAQHALVAGDHVTDGVVTYVAHV